MKTTDQKWRELYESVDWNWYHAISPMGFACYKGGSLFTREMNPSYAELQDVINLAKQLGYVTRMFPGGASRAVIIAKSGAKMTHVPYAGDDAEDLLNALWAAEGRE